MNTLPEVKNDPELNEKIKELNEIFSNLRIWIDNEKNPILKGLGKGFAYSAVALLSYLIKKENE